MASKLAGRARRKLRIRKKISGTTERPRLTVFRSNKQIYAQIVDDTTGNTLAVATSSKLEKVADANKSKRAEQVGEAIAQLRPPRNRDSAALGVMGICPPGSATRS